MSITTQFTEFNGHPLEIIQHQDQVWFNKEQIGEALGYADPRKSINKIYQRNKDELDEYSAEVKQSSGGVKLSPPGGEQTTRIFNEEGVMLLTMLSRQPKAAEFRRWAVKVLKAYRHSEPVAPVIDDSLMVISKDAMIAQQSTIIEIQHLLLKMQQEKLQPPVKPQRAKNTPVTREEIILFHKLKAQGLSHKAIANITKRSTGTISFSLRGAKGGAA